MTNLWRKISRSKQKQKKVASQQTPIESLIYPKMESASKFKTDFKYYKQRCPPPDFDKVLDFSNLKDSTAVKRINYPDPDFGIKLNAEEEFIATLMEPRSEWNIYELIDNPGLIFITNPFTSTGQRYWIHQCLQFYTRKPNRLNIDAHGVLDKDEDWWDSCQGDDQDSQLLQKKLRWATLGYHHNWDTKVYSENMKDIFPSDLAALSRYVGSAVRCCQDFSAQAAIVNFYHFDSTLSGHTDHSEMDMSAPLFSFSFGQTAIFLLGGTSLDIAPTAMYIKSGDIVIMSHNSRKCYHGIPRIIPANHSPWDTNTSPTVHNSNENVNLTTSECEEDYNCELACKRARLNISKPHSESLNLVKTQILDDVYWRPFMKYIMKSRINMNVRQVLHKRETSLNNKDS